MAFWVPYSDFKIGVEKKDIEEYEKKIRKGELPVATQKKKAAKDAGKDSQQQSFAYFIKNKMGLAFHQDASVEIGFKDEEAARKHLVKEGDKVPEDYKKRIPEEDAIDLDKIDISGLDFEGVTFHSTRSLDTVNFDQTLLHNSSMVHTDLSKSESITKASFNEIPKDGLSEEQTDYISKKISSGKRVTTTSADATKVKEALDDPGKATKALRLAQTFGGTMLMGESDDYILSMDQAFDVLRYQSLKTKDKALLDQVEKTSKKYIAAEVEAALKEVKFTPTSWSAWAWRSSSDTYSKKIEQIISDTLTEQIASDDFLKKHFSIKHADLKKFLREEVLTKAFVAKTQHAIQTLSSTEEDFETKGFKKITSNGVAKHVTEKALEWKSHQDVARNRWEELETLSKRKKLKKHVGISPETGNFVTRQLPDWCSPLKPSSYPAIDPYDKEAIVKDLALKQEGAEFLKQLSSVGAGTTVATFMAAFAPTGYTANALAGVTAGTVTSALLEHSISKSFNYDNYKEYDNQLGDKLLELGVMYKSMKPHLAILGIGGVNSIFFECLKTSGYLQEALSKYQKIVTSVSTYAAYSDFYATKDYLTKQRTKSNPQHRRRPGSKGFDLNLKHKLFSQGRFFTAIAVATAVLVAATVLVTAFPYAIPVLTAIAAKGVSLEVGALAITGFAAASGITYLSFGAMSKGVDRIKDFFTRRSYTVKLKAQADEGFKAKEKAADVIKSAFKNYRYRKTDKFRKVAEEIKSKRKTPEYLEQLIQTQRKDELTEDLKEKKSVATTKTTKKRGPKRKTHAEREFEKQSKARKAVRKK